MGHEPTPLAGVLIQRRLKVKFYRAAQTGLASSEDN
jgi:hypothetical protein